MTYAFPAGFLWGAATAAYQIEGAATAGGRKPSVWDTFSKTPGRVCTGETGDIACDHYHRFESDVRLMAELGIRNYRFSVAWPRILPDGTGAVNETGIDFYKRLLDCLQQHGITPHCTLFHWDSPQALEDRYGSWRSRQIADDFAAYVDVVVRRLGDRISDWMTINEIPCFTDLGYGVGKPGRHAPGTVVASRKEVHQTVHHALLAHGKAVQAIRAASPRSCRVALVDCAGSAIPLSETAADIAAAKTAFQDQWMNGMVTWGALNGRYSDAFVKRAERDGEMPDIAAGDMAIIRQPLDQYALNLYSGSWIRAADNALGYDKPALPKGYPRLDMDWLNLVPECLYWTPRFIRECTGFSGPVVISENGTAAQDSIDANGEVMDLDRIRYLKDYLRQVHRASREGLLHGYFVWSLLDNFEWAWGYSKRFGIIYTVYEDQRRILKQSAKWYADCIRANAVV
ncbi:beta-glucosidase [Planctomycetota bacterium]|nr:beta-glucosidase [Planctomycetota bacterium]